MSRQKYFPNSQKTIIRWLHEIIAYFYRIKTSGWSRELIISWNWLNVRVMDSEILKTFNADVYWIGILAKTLAYYILKNPIYLLNKTLNYPDYAKLPIFDWCLIFFVIFLARTSRIDRWSTLVRMVRAGRILTDRIIAKWFLLFYTLQPIQVGHMVPHLPEKAILCQELSYVLREWASQYVSHLGI